MDKAVKELKAELARARKAISALQIKRKAIYQTRLDEMKVYTDQIKALDAKRKEIFLSKGAEMSQISTQIDTERAKSAAVLKQIHELKYGSDRDSKGRPISKTKDRRG